MSAISIFHDILDNPEKVESIDREELLTNGNIHIKLKNLTEKEKEELSHLRISLSSGIMFDDRNCNPAIRLL